MAQPKRKDKDRSGERDEGAEPATDSGANASGAGSSGTSGSSSTSSTSSDTASAATDASSSWSLPKPLSRVTLGVVLGVIALLNLPMLHYYLFRPLPAAPVALPYANDFADPDSVTRDFFSTGGLWRTVGGELLAPGVKNNPLWLKAKLPQNVAVEFDVRSMSPEGDIKAEIFGDGSDHATGYVLIHGGWNNSVSIIARLDEHGQSMGALSASGGSLKPGTRVRVEANPYPVQIGKMYHWRIERRGGLITWLIDGREFMRFDDPNPLTGSGHDRFGFSSWEAQLYFDNLRVEPLN